MEDVLNRIINLASQRFSVDYAEARIQRISKTYITLKERRIETAKEGFESGVAIRVLLNGAWGFASTCILTMENLKNALTEACRMAIAASRQIKTPVEIAETKAIKDKVSVKPQKNPAQIPIEEKIRDLSSIAKTILNYDSRICGCTIDYLDIVGTNYFMNSRGTYIEQDMLYVWSRVTATAGEASILTFSREEIGSTAGYEIFDINHPENIGKKTAERAINQLKAKSPRGGRYPVVLGPNVVGVFVHEAFGHLAEADLTLSGSVLMDKLGEKIASENVTIYDDGTIYGAFGSFKYDDEGVPSQRTLLVKGGVVVNLMHNLETAKKFNVEPTGNARAESFKYAPIIRMRNTFLEPRDYSFEELLEDVKFGYYLKSFRGGQANLDGTFQVGIQEAYEIIHGEIGALVRDVSISGNTLETLFRVDAVGKDFELSPGRCGKGQTAFVSDGGPHIRVREVIVGGSA
ncbi:MAG: TldD/PmbA family protein [Candidatus Bathyarchaeia archaeon]